VVRASTNYTCHKVKKIILDTGGPYIILLLRIITGWRLLAGTWPYLIAEKPVQEVVDFFQSLTIPLPTISAYVSLYAQCACGILLIVGWLTRSAAFILAINFSVALLAAHLHDPIETSFQAWALWVISLYFLFHGAGNLSMDKLIDWFSFKWFEIKIDEL